VKNKVKEEYVQVDAVAWQPFPEVFSAGGIEWKLLHVSPESGNWAGIFRCPRGSSFAAHIHVGPGEYLLTKGKMEVRGGVEHGGATALAPGYGYEFYMTFQGPLQFIDAQGNPIAVVSWEQAQALWAQQTGAT
jgi:hypothetical protein